MADWLNNPLSQVMSPRLSSKSRSEHTPVISLSRRGSLDTNVDDLATTLDASEVCDRTDVGRLTSPLFSQERGESAIPFGVSRSQTHSSMEKSRRDTEQLSRLGKRLSKDERKSDLERVQDSQMKRERSSVRTKRHSRLP